MSVENDQKGQMGWVKMKKSSSKRILLKKIKVHGDSGKNEIFVKYWSS